MIIPTAVRSWTVWATGSTYNPHNSIDTSHHGTGSSGFPSLETIQGSDRNDLTKGWSSIIGIVTAIIGNVLISFALNTQRYAHIRQAREWEMLHKEKDEEEDYSTEDSQEEEEEERHAKGQHGVNGSTGRDATKDYPVGEERDSGSGHQAILHEEEEDDETQPLLISKSQKKDNSNATGFSKRDDFVDNNDSDNDSESDGDEQKTKNYLRSPYWWLGIVLMTVGEAGNFFAYGFAPASIVSPLGVVALISNCIIAPIMLKESFRKRDFLGVMVAIAGAVTVVLSANTSNPKLGPHEIWQRIKTWEFEMYLAVTLVVILVLIPASDKYGDRSIFIDLGLAGLLGGYTVLSTKGVASLLSYTLWRALTFPLTYLFILILTGSAVMQIKHVNRALQRFDSTRVIPTQFVLFTLSVILGSAILYRDFERTSAAAAGKFVGGCALTFAGVYLLTTGKRPQDESVAAPHESGNQEDEDASQDAEDSTRLLSCYPDEGSGAAKDHRINSLSRASQPKSRSRPTLHPFAAASGSAPLLVSPLTSQKHAGLGIKDGAASPQQDLLPSQLGENEVQLAEGARNNSNNDENNNNKGYFVDLASPTNSSIGSPGQQGPSLLPAKTQLRRSEHPPLRTALSVPIVSADDATEGTGVTASATGAASSRPVTPTRTAAAAQFAQLATSNSPDQSRKQARRSVAANKSPRPLLTSPLSSPLSIFVADSRRKETIDANNASSTTPRPRRPIGPSRLAVTSYSGTNRSAIGAKSANSARNESDQNR